MPDTCSHHPAPEDSDKIQRVLIFNEERMTQFSVDVTEDDFETQVIAVSSRVPVVVDFWAEWCGPCRVLKPLLEKLAEEYQGRFILAKVDSDQNQGLARQFAVRGIPTVVGLSGGKEVARFSGAQPEGMVREFLEKLIPSPADELVRVAGEVLAGGDVPHALRILDEALALDGGHPGARIAAAGILLQENRFDEAAAILAALSPAQRMDERVSALTARLDFALKSRALPDPAVLQACIGENGNDLQARLQLASLLTTRGDYEAALEQLLAIVRLDRKFGDDAGRKTMLEVFSLLGGSGELVSRYRRLLAQALN